MTRARQRRILSRRRLLVACPSTILLGDCPHLTAGEDVWTTTAPLPPGHRHLRLWVHRALRYGGTVTAPYDKGRSRAAPGRTSGRIPRGPPPLESAASGSHTLSPWTSLTPAHERSQDGELAVAAFACWVDVVVMFVSCRWSSDHGDDAVHLRVHRALAVLSRFVHRTRHGLLATTIVSAVTCTGSRTPSTSHTPAY